MKLTLQQGFHFVFFFVLQATVAVPLNPVASVAQASIYLATVVANVVRVNLVVAAATAVLDMVAVVAVAEVEQPPAVVAVATVAGPMTLPVTAQSSALVDVAMAVVIVCYLLH